MVAPCKRTNVSLSLSQSHVHTYTHTYTHTLFLRMVGLLVYLSICVCVCVCVRVCLRERKARTRARGESKGIFYGRGCRRCATSNSFLFRIYTSVSFSLFLYPIGRVRRWLFYCHLSTRKKRSILGEEFFNRHEKRSLDWKDAPLDISILPLFSRDISRETYTTWIYVPSSPLFALFFLLN